MGKNRIYLCYFDSTEFKMLEDITSYEHKALLCQIGDSREPDCPVDLTELLLDAYQNKNSPEIWTFISHVEREELYDYCIHRYQEFSEIIREYGDCLFPVNK